MAFRTPRSAAADVLTREPLPDGGCRLWLQLPDEPLPAARLATAVGLAAMVAILSAGFALWLRLTTLLALAAALWPLARWRRSRRLALEIDARRVRLVDGRGGALFAVERLAVRSVTMRPVDGERFALALDLGGGAAQLLPFALPLDACLAVGGCLWQALGDAGGRGYRHR